MSARRRTSRVWTALVLGGLAVGCRAATPVPEDGAMLLRVGLAAGAAMPDELRLSAYDDTGTLWSNARFPTEGPLVPQSASFLGTILLHAGTTVGNLRIDLRGLRAGALDAESILTITPAERASGSFDLTLSTALPSDGDGDGVPDPIDDCPAVPDPTQTGCGHDAAATDGPDAAAGGHGGAAGTDAGPTNLPRGAACGAASQCASGFCKDGACCNSACTDACNSCTTGTCTQVTNAEDVPECAAPMSCNKKGHCAAN